MCISIITLLVIAILSQSCTAYDIAKAIAILAAAIGCIALIGAIALILIGPPLEKFDESLPGANSSQEFNDHE